MSKNILASLGALCAVLCFSACTVIPMFNPPVTTEKSTVKSLDSDAITFLSGEWTCPEKNWSVSIAASDEKKEILSITAMIPDDKKEQKELPLIGVPVKLEGRLYAVLFADMSRVMRSDKYSNWLLLMIRSWFYMAELELAGDTMKFALVDFEKEEKKDGKTEKLLADPSVELKDNIVMNSSESLEKLIREKKYFRAEECTFRRVKK